MIHALAAMGQGFTLAVSIVTIVVILFGLSVTWSCGLCGKMNTTPFWKFLFRICDHGGLF